MKKTASELQFSDLPTDYAGLCRLHLPRPIHDPVDYGNTAGITDVMAGHDLTPEQEDYFDLLCRLLDDYDQARAATKTRRMRGLEVLRHLLQEQHLTAADLGRLLNVHRTLGAMILRGERNLTLSHVQILARHFKVSADVFIG